MIEETLEREGIQRGKSIMRIIKVKGRRVKSPTYESPHFKILEKMKNSVSCMISSGSNEIQKIKSGNVQRTTIQTFQGGQIESPKGNFRTRSIQGSRHSGS